MQLTKARCGLIIFGTLVLLLCARFSSGSGNSLVTAPDEAWTNPTQIAINNTGPVALGSDERSYDCTPLTYRMIDDLSKTMQQGCFVRSAFGLVDPDQSKAIFNGTDEAETINFGSSPAAISVLPDSAAVARFGGFPGQGTYMYLYSYFPGNLEQSHNIFLQRYKSLVGEPDFTVSNSDGMPLPVNPSALAYSARGQWLVTESPGHALVRINLATFAILPFAKSYDIPGKPYATHTASLAVTEDGRYAVAASNEFSTFNVYDLKTCTAVNDTDDLAPQNCTPHNYWQTIVSQVSGTLVSISHVHFVNDGLIGF